MMHEVPTCPGVSRQGLLRASGVRVRAARNMKHSADRVIVSDSSTEGCSQWAGGLESLITSRCVQACELPCETPCEGQSYRTSQRYYYGQVAEQGCGHVGSEWLGLEVLSCCRHLHSKLSAEGVTAALDAGELQHLVLYQLLEPDMKAHSMASSSKY